MQVTYLNITVALTSFVQRYKQDTLLLK